MADDEKKGLALVTGASGGLGRELALLFAKDGHDVVIVARSEDKLAEVAKEIEAAGAKAHVIAADLVDRAAPQKLFAETKKRGLAVDFLVNNAGFGSNGAFLELDRLRELEMVQVNCTALLELTWLFARPMKERKFGRILNIASTAGFQPGPFMATYYASKAFVLNFTEALAFELEGTGVTVTCHCPGATHTGFAQTSGNAESRLFQRSGVATAPEVALHAYRAMTSGDVVSVHGVLNWLGTQGVRFAPRSMVRSMAAAANRPAK
jgi:short-subunit dehydrogenase